MLTISNQIPLVTLLWIREIHTMTIHFVKIKDGMYSYYTFKSGLSQRPGEAPGYNPAEEIRLEVRIYEENMQWATLRWSQEFSHLKFLLDTLRQIYPSMQEVGDLLL